MKITFIYLENNQKQKATIYISERKINIQNEFNNFIKSIKNSHSYKLQNEEKIFNLIEYKIEK